MPSLAIVGAGCSALAAAHRLSAGGYHVTLFEKDQEVGGRAATRRQAGFIYDHGAQYIKQGSLSSVPLVTERFRTPDLLDIKEPVWTFDAQNQIHEGDPAQNAEPKWSYSSGLAAFPHRMAEGLAIRLECPVAALQYDAHGWTLFDAGGSSLGRFDRVLISIPSPQAVELILQSQVPESLRTAIVSHLSQANYNSLLSVMLGFQPAPAPRPFYALVNTDKAHAISWLAWEHLKSSERVPPGYGLLIAQMSPPYSRSNWNTPPTELYADVLARISKLLDEQLPPPIFSDLQRWRYALPSSQADATSLFATTLPFGLAFCGDAFVGGRVHLALEHGIIAAQQLLL